MRPSYEQLYQMLLTNGIPTASRMGPTREALGVSVAFAAGEMVARRGINDALGFMELMQLLAGVFDPAAIARVAPRADHSLFTEQMAYGPRIASQVPGLIQKLLDDPDTRQAVLWFGGKADGLSNGLPCTMSMQFLIRQDQLHAVTSMRSWDVTRGLAYDIVMQGGLVLALARCLDIPAGGVVCTGGSVHLYLDQEVKQPRQRQRHFTFGDDAPRRWLGIQLWAQNQISTLERVPDGIEVHEELGLVVVR